MARKEAGHVYPEGVVPPTPTGRKATVVMNVQVFVEVNETDSYEQMVSQAKESLRKRVIEGKGFYPFSARAEHIHPDVEVEELKYHTVVEPRGKW